MDYSIFKALRRHFIYVEVPSPFSNPRVWANVSKSLWSVLREPDMKTFWSKDQGLYKRTVQLAKYCEDRSNG